MSLDIFRVQIQEQLSEYLDRFAPVLRNDLMVALQEPGKVFAPAYHGSVMPGAWSLLTLFIARSSSSEMISGEEQISRLAAAGLECLICSLDLLDDLEDGDTTSVVKMLGHSRTLNVSTALWTLCQQLLSSPLIPQEQSVRLHRTMGEALLHATSGQHKDIFTRESTREQCTPLACLEIAEEKAGSLMQLACRFGAICANMNDTHYTQWSNFGLLFGIAQQLRNDACDLEREISLGATTSYKSDLSSGQKTLPILYANEQSAHFSDPIGALRQGIFMTQGIADFYRKKALEALEDAPLSPELCELVNIPNTGN